MRRLVMALPKRKHQTLELRHIVHAFYFEFLIFFCLRINVVGLRLPRIKVKCARLYNRLLERSRDPLHFHSPIFTKTCRVGYCFRIWLDALEASTHRVCKRGLRYRS